MGRLTGSEEYILKRTLKEFHMCRFEELQSEHMKSKNIRR